MRSLRDLGVKRERLGLRLGPASSRIVPAENREGF
jgi:hypothetical protein